jgi:2',3'-cyclic-nucleotide 2'-phosphodiesterase (5'-nucleotidase family)
VLDSGNALFKSPLAEGDPTARPRAELLLTVMGQLGTAALAVGHRDLGLGPAFLKDKAAAAKVPLLSANLTDAGGKPLFPGSREVKVGTIRVGLVGVTTQTPAPGAKDLKAMPAAAAVKAELEKLKGKTDLRIVLAAMPYEEALALQKSLGPAVDFILQSHDSRMGGAPVKEGSTLLGSGERGRNPVRLELRGIFAKGGGFQDLGGVDRDRQMKAFLANQLQTAQKRLSEAKPDDTATRQGYEQAIAGFKHRIAELDQHAKDPVASRTFAQTFVNLGSDVASDPTVKGRVEKIEPPGTAAH